MDCIVHGGHKESDTTERLSLSRQVCWFCIKCRWLVVGFLSFRQVLRSLPDGAQCGSVAGELAGGLPGSWSPLLSLSLSNPPPEVRSPPTVAAPHMLRKPCFPEERWHYYPSFVTSKPSMPLLVSRNCYVFTLEGSFVNDAVCLLIFLQNSCLCWVSPRSLGSLDPVAVKVTRVRMEQTERPGYLTGPECKWLKRKIADISKQTITQPQG